ncbi:28S ribosomal protein S33, mitochondrial-like [Daphnia magna]|uniref:Small ribosomal subunit protein mS33 n=3 Tax=Daphnia magna TaxID=35525 RepID=A0A0P5Z7C1_9CRUS|nr:28S ribosomal protein S33, mitochondrial [Daphnia magna]XP_045034775.1 28S ribosomal protein S33, mitochondrial-like [Daphnia magna]XP_045034776.1 28S ribosomal protein S33, mitochondrial-like [Daphnia magna]KAK4030648.1 hypothetical protein OUZ56_023921 [Daphnia magna]KZS03161.1 Mitochondrial ribosomal protein S33 [Daphnia magna]
MASKFYNYIKLVQTATPYAKRIEQLSSRIFGEVARPTSAKSLKVVDMFSSQPTEQRPDIKNYYPRHVEIHVLMRNLRNYGLFRDEHQDFKEEITRLRELRGKGKPKKGEGKRSKK